MSDEIRRMEETGVNFLHVPQFVELAAKLCVTGAALNCAGVSWGTGVVVAQGLEPMSCCWKDVGQFPWSECQSGQDTKPPKLAPCIATTAISV